MSQTENKVPGAADYNPLLIDWARHNKNANHGGVKYSTLQSYPENISTYNIHLQEQVVSSVARNKHFVMA